MTVLKKLKWKTELEAAKRGKKKPREDLLDLKNLAQEAKRNSAFVELLSKSMKIRKQRSGPKMQKKLFLK